MTSSYGFIQLAKKNIIPLFFQLAGISIVILNLWLASKLAPLAEDIRTLSHRVEAVESSKADDTDFQRRFIVVEEKVKNIELKIDKMDTKLDNIDTKINSLR